MSEFEELPRRRRLEYVREKLKTIETEPDSELIIRLFNGHPSCTDGELRSQVGLLIAKASKVDPETFETLISKTAADKLHRSTSDLVTLLQWTNFVLEVTGPRPLLISAQAALLGRVLVPNRERLVRSAVQHLKSSLVRFSRVHGSAAHLALLKEGSLNSLYITSLLAGAGIEGASTGNPTLEVSVKELIPEWSKLYTQAVLGAKVAPADEGLDALHFAIGLIDQSTFDGIIVPAISRALLRAPETALVSVLPKLVSQLDSQLDLTSATDQSLKSLISNISSSNPKLRQSATDFLGLLLRNLKLPTGRAKILQETTSAFTKTTASDQRALFAQALLQVNPEILSQDEIDTLSTSAVAVAKKDGNEASIHYIAKLCAQLLPGTEEAIVAGLTDSKRPVLRREWSCALAEKISPNHFSNLSDKIKPALTSLLQDVISNPGGALSSKLIAAGYAALYLTSDVSGLVLLEDEKIYRRLASSQELTFAAKAAESLARPSFAEVLVHLAAISPSPRESHLIALEVLKKTYKADVGNLGPAIADVVTQKIDLYPSLKDIIKIFSETSDNEETPSKALSHLLIAAHHEKGLISDGWTGLCLRAGVDPGRLIKSDFKDMLRRIFEAPTELRAASNGALATLAFINPELITPEIVTFIKASLIPVYPSKDDIIILSCKDGELAPTAEVVKNKNISSAPRSGKDKEIAEWEEEVRQHIAKKQGPKLSKEDLVIVEEQREVRKRLSKITASYDHAISIIDTLSLQTLPNGIDAWFPETVSLYIALGKSELGRNAVTSLEGLTRNISPRFAELRNLVGIAVTAKLGLSKVGTTSQVGNILYRAKFLADSRPLDTVTLIYFLPMLTAIIKESTGNLSEEQEEHLLLALNILASQADELVRVPRADLIPSLISLLSRNFDKAKDIKDTLQRIAQSVIFSKEELDIVLAAASNKNPYVRTAVLEIIDSEVDLSDREFAPEIWIAKFSDDAAIADTIWQESNMSVPCDAHVLLSSYLGYEIRDFVAKSIATAVAENRDLLVPALSELVKLFKVATEPPKPKFDEYGIEIKAQFKDPWELRSGYITALNLMVPLLESDWVLKLIDFVAETAVLDQNQNVYQLSQSLGLNLTETHGAANLNQILPKLETLLAGKYTRDEVREAHVVFYGSVARHLPSDDQRLASIVDRLLDSLLSPSESVQYSVSECLAPLAKRLEPQSHIEKLLERLFSGATTEIRRGAAFGLAGLSKGIGLSSLSDYGIIREITTAIDDKKDISRRQGSQLAIDCLSRSLGRLFEPYALELLPLVLTGLGDLNNTVREAASSAARSIMKHTTGFGIKKQIPLALDRLNETAWRGKKGSVELLGTMAYLDPQQLSVSLSTIVPEIVGALNDTHKEVRAAAKGSLQSFGEVIQNPEIRQLVPQLLNAIGDPTKYTEAALDALLKTKFVHFIDSPSLALVIHVVKRGLRDRSANTKRRAGQVVGNMSILAEAEDILPYLPEIMPDLHVAMTDPVPATSTTASKALGVLVEKLGEEHFPQVIPDLFETLKDPAKAGDRWGSAQGLSEVIHGLGLTKLDELLPNIIKLCYSPKSAVRQSFILMMIFLPASFGQNITPYLNQITPTILHGLADTVDDVRENALKAGRLIVKNFASKAVDLLLPELELGLSDVNYRIRLSSVELTGDLLFQLAGVSKNLAEDVSISGKIQAIIIETLGLERRDRILASLFICRADTSGQVRTSATEVWMSLVANTPRTVKEILPTLTQIVVRRLSSEEDETRTIASRALVELVRRVSNALIQILPILKDLKSDPEAKEGISHGITELIKSTPMEVIQENEAEITDLIRGFLTDQDNNVRESASRAFDALHEALGEVAHDLLPGLISQMESGDEGALAALKEMMGTSPDVVFPALLPTLLKAPMTASKAKNLADVSEVAGSNLYRHIEDIIDGFLNALATEKNTEIAVAFDRVLAVYAPQNHLLIIVKNEESVRRQLVYEHVANLFFNDPNNIDETFASDWISFGILSLEDSDHSIVESAWNMLHALTSNSSKDNLVKLVEPAYTTLKMTSSPLPGFQLPKGISCILPIFLQGLILGSNLEKDHSAIGLADIVERTEPEQLKPYVTQITGPLIRVVGEKYSSDIKTAIMFTLNALLTKIPMYLKPFLPQLQRTFAKSLSDASSAILRSRAAKALGTLISLQTRLDPLAKEIITGIKTSTDTGVTVSMLMALLEIVTRAGKGLSDPVKTSIYELFDDEEISEVDMRKISLVAKVKAAMIAVMPEKSTEFIRQMLMGPNSILSLATANALFVFALPETISSGLTDEICGMFTRNSNNTEGYYAELAISGIGKYLLSDFEKREGASLAITNIIETIQKDDSRTSKTRRLSLLILRALARSKPELARAHLDELIVPLFSAVRDINVPVKLAAENTFLDIFGFLEHGDSKYFDEWFTGASERGVFQNANLQRSISEYVRRVAMRHTAARIEQREAGTPDNISEDLEEIWAIVFFEPK